jgi:hypothetical protein
MNVSAMTVDEVTRLEAERFIQVRLTAHVAHVESIHMHLIDSQPKSNAIFPLN